jgi:hypothetical protein
MTEPFRGKLGKLNPKFDPTVKFYTTYRQASSPVIPPKTFGYGYQFTNWGMNGNDDWGDCVLAGGAHETELIGALAAGAPKNDFVVEVTTANSLSDYSAITGFDPNAGPPNNNPTDQGTDVQTALAYRQSTGLIDSTGKRHKIAAYVSLEVGNLQHLLEALWIFDAVGIGIQFPESAMTQFNAGQVWSVVPGAQIDGGHYIPLIGVPAVGNLTCVTWAKRQVLTSTFYTKYCDEAYAYITQDSLNAKTKENPGGFDWAQLSADLQAVA